MTWVFGGLAQWQLHLLAVTPWIVRVLGATPGELSGQTRVNWPFGDVI